MLLLLCLLPVLALAQEENTLLNQWIEAIDTDDNGVISIDEAKHVVYGVSTGCNLITIYGLIMLVSNIYLIIEWFYYIKAEIVLHGQWNC